MRYTLLAVFAGAAVTLAACSGGSPQGPSTPYVPTPDQTTLLPQSGPAPLKPGASPQAGCPVDNATLEKALAADPAIAAAVQLGKGLTDISCAADFATAHTEGDRATVLFRFDGAQKMWVAVSGAAKNSCESVPTDVRKQLKNCA